LVVMRSFSRVIRKMRMLRVMRTSSMMSDLLMGSSIALLPFWCLDAKGGRSSSIRICFGLGISLIFFSFL
jgi:hypothetical protein